MKTASGFGKALQNERGSALWMAAVLLACLSCALTGTQVAQWQNRKLMQYQNVASQADNVARAGIADAANWFRRQPNPPVVAFNPQQALGDTLRDGALVKEYSLNKATSLGHLWGRYELISSPSGSNREGVRDDTTLRVPGQTTNSGMSWRLESVGYTYLLIDPTKAFNTAPNRILATTRVASEIRLMTLTLPGNAAVYVNDVSLVTLQNGARIDGGVGDGLAYFDGPGKMPVACAGCISSLNDLGLSGGTVKDISPEAVFSASFDDLKVLADVSLRGGDPLPTPFPDLNLIYIDGDATFDATNPLRGSGVVIVRGNVTALSQSNTYFSGVLYVGGNATFTGAAALSGTTIVLGNLTLNGQNDVIDVDLRQPAVLSIARQTMARYRNYHSSTYQFTAVP
jgi:hypothetical protein